MCQGVGSKNKDEWQGYARTMSINIDMKGQIGKTLDFVPGEALDWEKEQEKDPNLKRIREFIATEKPSHAESQKEESEVRCLLRDWKKLYIDPSDRVLYRKT